MLCPDASPTLITPPQDAEVLSFAPGFYLHDMESLLDRVCPLDSCRVYFVITLRVLLTLFLHGNKEKQRDNPVEATKHPPNRIPLSVTQNSRQRPSFN